MQISELKELETTGYYVLEATLLSFICIEQFVQKICNRQSLIRKDLPVTKIKYFIMRNDPQRLNKNINHSKKGS